MTLTQLKNIAARLKNIKNENVKFYYNTLVEAKEIKAQAALNRVSINFSLINLMLIFFAYGDCMKHSEFSGNVSMKKENQEF